MAETDQQGHEVFNFVQVSSDFGTNMTSVGFQVIIYITMFLVVTPCSDECFEGTYPTNGGSTAGHYTVSHLRRLVSMTVTAPLQSSRQH